MSSQLRSYCDEIIELHQELGGLVTRSVQIIWTIGRNLAEVKGRLDHGHFLPWVKENLPFSDETARKYMKVFERFPGGLPEGMDLKTAYVEAGVKKLAAPEVQDAESADAGELVVPARDWAKEWARLARSPTLSGEPLKNYRVVVNSHERAVYALRRGHHEPIPVAGVLLPLQPGTEAAWEEYSKMLQITTEHLLAQLEALEDAGVIQPPSDNSPLGKLARGRKKISQGGTHVHQ